MDIVSATKRLVRVMRRLVRRTMRGAAQLGTDHVDRGSGEAMECIAEERHRRR